ncbi:cellulose biosynthesis cyclic di-GMP-binding regulatory protein BcsB [Paraburkholderia rhynchosiae]|uniref:Cyclic di-GMP-binding protein n=1 Tax=Paraburkholderia rhynchosiae TaxID=487049 RepID=A0A2N7VXR8_9BURK|nr:cellulose biosynthesis cyclic di-GMP-binding regulatory protein BcsB [Paraburkholderia rhynchosiae]PMS21928.1 hypothetical protein C0Z16_33310 [Paraburkholderia rhynchosiae]CAB3739059.1 hypothetical protein LMG27174_06519 [Paraburkholderia rhynchosiae]
MMTIHRSTTAALLVAASLFASLATQTAAGKESASSQPVVKRSIAIAELGFTDGANFGSLGGTQEFFFPVPRAARVTSATLSLGYDEASPFDGRRSVLIQVGERTVVSRALPAGHDRQMIEVPLGAGDFAGDFVKVSVIYSGAFTNDRCADVRSANDRFTVLPETALKLNVAQDSLNQVSTVLTLMPGRIAVGIPERKLTEREAAAVISAVRLFKARGREVEVVPLTQLLARPGADDSAWQRGDVVIASPQDFGDRLHADAASSTATSAASVVRLADGPGLLLSGSDPQIAANLLGSDWQIAAADHAIRVDAMQPMPRSQDRLTFDKLGLATPVSHVPGEAVWTASFSARDIPPGRWPAALNLDLGIGEDGSEIPAVANVFVNGRFIASTRAAKQGITHLYAKLPHGLVSLDNQVRVVVQRQSRTGDCTYLPANFPAQLLGSSALELGSAEQPAHDFFSVASNARDQLTVVVRDPAAETQRTALQTLGIVAADLVPTGTPIVVKYATSDSLPETSSAFVAWGNFRFAGADSPVRIDAGKVLVRTRAGTPLFSLDGTRSTLIAQIVTPPGAPSGIWLSHPGASAMPAPQTVGLDRGNVAFVDQTGVTLALSTEREKLIEVTYPESTSWRAVITRYRVWLIGAVWLLITLTVVVALQRIQRRRQRERGEQ